MSTITPELDEKAYGQLLRRTLPHVIRADDECARLTTELLRLDEIEDPSTEEKELAELLTVLIDDYEQRLYPIRKSSPQQTLHHLMEARNLTQKDLWKLFGSKGITSEVFHGKRSISKTQAKKLAAFFRVTADLFILENSRSAIGKNPPGPVAPLTTKPIRKNQLYKAGNPAGIKSLIADLVLPVPLPGMFCLIAAWCI